MNRIRAGGIMDFSAGIRKFINLKSLSLNFDGYGVLRNEFDNKSLVYFC